MEPLLCTRQWAKYWEYDVNATQSWGEILGVLLSTSMKNHCHHGTMKCGRTMLRLQMRLGGLGSPVDGIKPTQVCESAQVAEKTATLKLLSKYLQAPEKKVIVV